MESKTSSITSEIFNVPVDVGGYRQACNEVSAWVNHPTKPARYVVQTNVQTLVRSHEDSAYLEVVREADLSVPDGMPVVWILRHRKYVNVERIYGPDLMLMLCERAAKEGWRCFLYGGRPGVPEKLKRNLTDRFPGLKFVGTFSPPFRSLTADEDAQVCSMINAAQPDILWVGIGAPKQDVWMHEHRDKLNVAVMHGVGAAFDFLTGEVRQAPRWMMNAGLEWSFRLMQEPRRLWKRYTLMNAKFVWYLFRESLRPK